MTREEMIDKAVKAIERAETGSRHMHQQELDVADRWIKLAIEGFPINAPLRIGNNL